MCKLLEIKGHPHKFVECKNKCFTAEWLNASVALYGIILASALVWLYLLS